MFHVKLFLLLMIMFHVEQHMYYFIVVSRETL